jgi:hypothetical protein
MERARRVSLTGGIAALTAAVLISLSVLAGASFGRAQVGTFQLQNPVSDTVDDTDTCLGPGATGTITGTETVVGHFTETGPPALNFDAHGTSTLVYRVDYADGRYVLGTSVEHFKSTGNTPQLGDISVTRDQGTLYGPGGQQLGQVIVHAVTHLTFRDANGNFQPDPGEIIVNVDHFRLTCR